jgi:hypothetical protein
MACLWHAKDLSIAPFGPNAPRLALAEVDYEDDALGSGGFGSVHRITAINGASIPGLLLKIIHQQQNADHAYVAIRLLHKKLRDRYGEDLTVEHPELLGLPFLVFRAVDDQGDTVVAMVMRDLIELSFADVGSDDWDSAEYFREVPFDNKLHLAYQFAHAFEILEAVGFIHADLKESSLFLNTRQPQLALIDFDSGFHPAEQPAAATIGALSPWAGNRMRDWIKSGAGPGQLTVQEREEEERWSLAAGIFEMLTGVPPYFFLLDGDEASIAAYLKDHDWPEVTPGHPLVNAGNLPFLEVVQGLLKALETAGGEDLVAAFKRAFKRGYFKPTARPTAAVWSGLLKGLVQDNVGKPYVLSFGANIQLLQRQDENVVLSWSVHHHRVLYLNGMPQAAGATEVTVVPGGQQRYELVAVNDQGTSSVTLLVEADRREPIIQWFRLKKWVDAEKNLAELEWHVDHAIKVELKPGPGEVSSQGSAIVSLDQSTSCQIKATGGFGRVVTMQMIIARPKSILVPILSMAGMALIIMLIFWAYPDDSSTAQNDQFERTDAGHPPSAMNKEVQIDVLDPTGSLVQEPTMIIFSGDTSFSMSFPDGACKVRLHKRFSPLFVRAETSSWGASELLLLDVSARSSMSIRVWSMVATVDVEQPVSVGYTNGTMTAPEENDDERAVPTSANGGDGGRTVYYDLNGDGVGGTRTMVIPKGKDTPQGYVDRGGDVRDQEKLRLTIADRPAFLLPAGCGTSSGSTITLIVESPDGVPVPNCTITLGLGVPVNWITAPKVFRESTGTNSVRTDHTGTVNLRFAPPVKNNGPRNVQLSFAVSGATARMATVMSTTIPVCPNCNPCY